MGGPFTNAGKLLSGNEAHSFKDNPPVRHLHWQREVTRRMHGLRLSSEPFWWSLMEEGANAKGIMWSKVFA